MFAFGAAAMLWAGCSNDVALESPDQNTGNPVDGETVTVHFGLGLPSGDEVNYANARADVLHDASEWKLETLKVYHFNSSEETPTDEQYKLANTYKIPVKQTGDAASGLCVKTEDAKYNLTLSLRAKTTGKHTFAIVANDSCSTFDESLVLGTTTLADLKRCVADKQVDNDNKDASLFIGNPAGLGITGLLENQTLTGGSNTLGNVTMTRIMARLDVQNFVPESRNFQILSVKVKYPTNTGAPKGYLFQHLSADAKAQLVTAPGGNSIWDTAEAIEINQNPVYEGKYTTYDAANVDMKDTWVSTCTTDNRTGVWYKKVLYMYEYPKKINFDTTPAVAEVSYTLNGWPSTAEIQMKDANKNPIDLLRNHVYTLQVGETSSQGGALTFIFVDSPWSIHEVDADLNDGKENN